MKRLGAVLSILLLSSMTAGSKACAQEFIAEIIKAGIKKVIKAVDLKIQRLQNQTIWLQNAQKVVENTMSEMKLNEITDWVERQRTLYKDYYDELWQVKITIQSYYRLKEIIGKQVQIISEYKNAWRLFRQDKHFTDDEMNYMQQVYTGILDESVRSLDEVFLVINSFQTQIGDAERIAII